MRIGIEAVSKEKCLLTFGIVPHRPETGYGYVKVGQPYLEVEASQVYCVDEFIEKPSLARAQEYVASGNYLWNSGMFVWTVADILEAVEMYLPTVRT